MKQSSFWATLAASTALASGAWASAETCAAATDLAVEGVTITGAVYAPTGEDAPTDHCILSAVMDGRTGTDGKTYALRFEIRLPDTWERRFMHQFNGGNDGKVVPALGQGTGIRAPALSRGFAIVSSDAGHDGAANPDAGLAGSNMFGFDFEARRDYGYTAVAKLHPKALALTEAYYGRAPDYVYGYGTSNGGRHGMVAAERMPDAFDGILSGYPGFNLPKAAIQHAWNVQLFRSVGETLQSSFTREEMSIAGEAVTAACDGLDGLEDGVVANATACQASFDPSAMACSDGQNSACLDPAKVEVLTKVMAGPVNSKGEPLYNSWYWEPGMASGNWRFWNLESPIPPWGNQPLIAVMGAGSLAQIFTTPPTPVGGSPEALGDYLMGFDFDADAPKIFATSADFPESAMEVMTPPNAENPTLAALQEAGGKLIVFHGIADPVFSYKDTVDWYDRLTANNPAATEFTRLYAVPGMPHGRGGNAADDFDLLDALIGWVEAGDAPGVIEARFRDDNAEAAANAGATRPLCPYPGQPIYTGDDPAAMDSFTCQ